MLVYSEGMYLYKADVQNPVQTLKLFSVVPEEITSFAYDPLNKVYYIGSAEGLYLLPTGKSRPRYVALGKHVSRDYIHDPSCNFILI